MGDYKQICPVYSFNLIKKLRQSQQSEMVSNFCFYAAAKTFSTGRPESKVHRETIISSQMEISLRPFITVGTGNKVL